LLAAAAVARHAAIVRQADEIGHAAPDDTVTP
jgi:hypothetical protein